LGHPMYRDDGQIPQAESVPCRVRVEGSESWLATDLRFAIGHWARFRGLMLSRSLSPGEGLVIPGCSSIHMMFMRYAIDAVFYDQRHQVTKVARRVRPWIGLAWGGRATAGVIELAAGMASQVEAGQQLEFLE